MTSVTDTLTSAHLDELALDAARAGDASASAAAHLAACPACRAELDSLTALAGLLQAPPLPVVVPDAQDRALRALARQAASRVIAARRRRVAIAVTGLIAAAAVAALVFRVAWPSGAGVRDSDKIVAMDPSDVNRDGRVDIIDAYLVARAIDHGHAIPPEWDVTGDSVIDRRDVDAIAGRAVAIDAEAM